MKSPEFVYTTFIKTTPEKLWSALTNPEFTKQYWGGGMNMSDWKKGSTWKHLGQDQRTVKITGQVVESFPPNRLVLTWADPGDPADVSTVTFEIENLGSMMSLKVTHGAFKAGSSMSEKVSWGWPRVLSSLKTYLETGAGLDVWAGGHACGDSSCQPA